MRFELGTFRSWSRWHTNVPPCFPCTMIFSTKPQKLLLVFNKITNSGSFWVNCVYFSCYFFSRMPLSIGLIYSFPIFSQVSSLSPNLSLAFSRNQTLMNLLFNFWWVFLFFYFFVFYLWNTGLITEFSKSVLQFW